MRISDWSSDVCSSDLHNRVDAGKIGRYHAAHQVAYLSGRIPHPGPDDIDGRQRPTDSQRYDGQDSQARPAFAPGMARPGAVGNGLCHQMALRMRPLTASRTKMAAMRHRVWDREKAQAERRKAFLTA